MPLMWNYPWIGLLWIVVGYGLWNNLLISFFPLDLDNSSSYIVNTKYPMTTSQVVYVDGHTDITFTNDSSIFSVVTVVVSHIISLALEEVALFSLTADIIQHNRLRSHSKMSPGHRHSVYTCIWIGQ